MVTVLRVLGSPVVLVYQSVALALSQIWANKMRGFLTTLGILIGVAAVSAVIALISGMRDRVMSEFEAFGTNKLMVYPSFNQKDLRKRPWTDFVFKNSDFDELLERCPSVERYERNAGYGAIPVSYGPTVQDQNVRFNGIDPDFHVLERRGAAVGRPLTEMDSQLHRRVAVINREMRDKLKLDRDPTGQVINVGYFGRLLVVGLLEQPVSMLSGENNVNEVYVPFTFSTTKYNFPTYYVVMASAKPGTEVDEAKAEVEFYMRQKRHVKPGEKDTFAVETAQRAIENLNVLARVVTTIATGIVGISLLVGGVGIMNIMLVSVSERTREIGLRKAVGAKPSAILLQFLIEAVVLCLVGGALGLAMGQVITTGVSSQLPGPENSWGTASATDVAEVRPERKSPPMIVPPLAVAVAFGFSVTVGVVFGMFPAIKAARLDPIEALRHE